MTSADEELAIYLHGELLPLTEPLHEAFALAEDDAVRHLPPYQNAGHMSWLKSGHMRLGVREHLAAKGLSGWSITGNANLTGQLSLTNNDGQVVLRVLKDGRPPKRTVPAAGHNRLRRTYWRNTPLFEFPQEALFGSTKHRLLLLWAPGADGAFELRVVRPINEGKYRGQVQADFCMELAPTRTDFENLRFVGEDHEEDLFMTIHSDERSEDGEGAG
ncbi:hypothetical protein [Paenarthrobacter nicotinovorans]|uniref:hypothetical protein n=1 Tax=Paenarthrobacter nicotinovorans TaxID=29320 RepID=UPI0007E79899|nr:hypothetical protein [Paenarthrobacter nicotinovorans]